MRVQARSAVPVRARSSAEDPRQLPSWAQRGGAAGAQQQQPGNIGGGRASSAPKVVRAANNAGRSVLEPFGDGGIDNIIHAPRSLIFFYLFCACELLRQQCSKSRRCFKLRQAMAQGYGQRGAPCPGGGATKPRRGQRPVVREEEVQWARSRSSGAARERHGESPSVF